MEFGTFKYFITWHPIAIERAVPLEKFLYFIKETKKTGVLPEITKQELINIRNYIKWVRRQDLVELRDKVLEEIKINAVSIPQDNFKKYIIYMEEELEPILTCMDELNLFSLIRTENLYPMPLSFSDKDLWKGNTFDEWRKLDAIPLSKMKNYTDNERDIYRYLERLFEVSMSHCMHFNDVKDFIEEINPSKKSDLTAFQKALKQWHLEQYTKEPNREPRLQGSGILKKYGVKKVEPLLNEIRKYYDSNKELDVNRKGFKEDLKKVHNSLSDHPDIQKVIINYLDQLD